MDSPTKKDAYHVNVEDIIKTYKVANIASFTSYLKEIYFDLAQRSENKKKGLDKLTFNSYYKLPGILSERLFAVFDTTKCSYIDSPNFINGMITLFVEPFEQSSKLIFNFYDFDKDGYLTKEDIRIVLSYVTLHNENNSLSARKYIDRVNSQEELHKILNAIFENVPSHYMNYEQFIRVIENVNSDIYFFILLFLYENKPFNKMGLMEYEKQRKIESRLIESPPKFVRRPTKHSTFSSCVTFLRSPIRKRTVEERIENDNNLFVGRSGKKTKTTQMTGINFLRDQKDRKIGIISNSIASNNDRMRRKEKINLKEIDKSPAKRKVVKKNNEVKITPAFKQQNSFKQSNDNEHNDNNNEQSKKKKIMLKTQSNNPFQTEPNLTQMISLSKDFLVTEPSSIIVLTPLNDSNKITKVNEIYTNTITQDTNTITNDNNTHELVFDSDDDDDDELLEDENLVKFEGFLYKLVDTQMKRLWFKLVHNDLYFFKTNKDTQHKGMHNLSGVFFQEDQPYIYCKKTYYSFILNFTNKERKYYCDDLSQYKLWIENIKIATGFTNLTDIYEIGEKIGSGKFGQIKLGINKRTRKKYAIKIMSKGDMESTEIELVKTEIEIMKICQHPNIIQVYDVFENVEYFYIIMEYCSGGDLFSYLEKRGFRLSEIRSCEIIHKMCAALFYIHSYGIIHRDLKPENVLMTNDSDHADIRILDFGLSKILGPDETSTEPYGTLSYCAPEVLLEEPYNKAVDLWSIGIITYLLLSGSLPFDHKTDEKEIIRQTIYDPLPYKGKVWNILSKESKDFIENLLQKDGKKRMNIKEALEHKWIRKFYNKVIEERQEIKGSDFKIYSLANNEGLKFDNNDEEVD